MSDCPHENTTLIVETTVCLDCGAEWHWVPGGLDEDSITLDEQYGRDPWVED